MKPRYMVMASALILASCKHPLQISGEGDIVELNEGVRGCTLEEFEAQDARCTDNDVEGDYNVVYEAQPRPGWTFVSWNGECGEVPRGQCQFNIPASLPAYWDENFPGQPVTPLVATFDIADAVGADQGYTGSLFGKDDSEEFSALLDATLFADRRYDYEAVLESNLGANDFGDGFYQRSFDGLVRVSANESGYQSAGAATAKFDLAALVDYDASDSEIWVALLTETLQGASNSTLNGTYYCGFIDTDTAGSYAQITLNGDGVGAILITDNTQGELGVAPVSYSVDSDGRMVMDYAGNRLVGGASANGDFVALTRTQDSVQGSGMCIRTSSGKSLDDVAGQYYGVYADAEPVTAVSELTIRRSGVVDSTLLADSNGASEAPAEPRGISVMGDGRLTVGSERGMVSPDGRVGFLVDASSDGQPSLTVYIRKTRC